MNPYTVDASESRSSSATQLLIIDQSIPMLDPWIIEEILRREEEQRRDHERGRVIVPLEPPQYRERGPSMPGTDEDSNRGVTIIDI